MRLLLIILLGFTTANFSRAEERVPRAFLGKWVQVSRKDHDKEFIASGGSPIYSLNTFADRGSYWVLTAHMAPGFSDVGAVDYRFVLRPDGTSTAWVTDASYSPGPYLWTASANRLTIRPARFFAGRPTFDLWKSNGVVRLKEIWPPNRLHPNRSFGTDFFTWVRR